MRIGIDVTSAVRQGAGIGRFTRELVRAFLSLDSPHEYALFAATGGLPRATTEPRLAYMTQSAIARRRFPVTLTTARLCRNAATGLGKGTTLGPQLRDLQDAATYFRAPGWNPAATP